MISKFFWGPPLFLPRTSEMNYIDFRIMSIKRLFQLWVLGQLPQNLCLALGLVVIQIVIHDLVDVPVMYKNAPSIIMNASDATL